MICWCFQSIFRETPKPIFLLVPPNIHPGRFTAGIYKSPILEYFRKENDLNQTSRDYVQHVNLQGFQHAVFVLIRSSQNWIPSSAMVPTSCLDPGGFP